MEGAPRAELTRLMAALADGDRDAFHPVFVRLWPVVRAFVGRVLPHADADDVAQQALLNVFTRISEFDCRRDAVSWALGIAAWEVRTARRRALRRREHPRSDVALAGVADPARGPEEEALARAAEADLEQALASLPPLDVQTLVAFARDERPPVPPATFRKRLERALRRLRAAWKEGHALD